MSSTGFVGTDDVEGLMARKRRMAEEGRVTAHVEFHLSDLDLEMIRPVPPGGSWKDIPPETVAKSRRLTSITRNGGRTTLYGRLDYNKPSYTITTLFNRPGNGTFVHPVHDRVITPREAARLQGFPDGYIFAGPKTRMLKQIGNAVPPILAREIAARIIRETGMRRTAGLFSGAGGLSLGFRTAGAESCIETDIEPLACATLKANAPGTPVLCADITQEDTKALIAGRMAEEDAEIICGGPPCQGFSLAGKRREDDPRNSLFRHYAQIVSSTEPEVVVFENVIGLLSMSGGQTYRDVLAAFAGIGYDVEGRVLDASDYGTPQRRRRVIVIGTKRGSGIAPGDLFPAPTTPDEEGKVTVRDAISDLEDVPCMEGAEYGRCGALSAYAESMRAACD